MHSLGSKFTLLTKVSLDFFSQGSPQIINEETVGMCEWIRQAFSSQQLYMHQSWCLAASAYEGQYIVCVV